MQLEEGIEYHTNRLKTIWKQHKDRDNRSPNALFNSICIAFMPDYFKLMFANALMAVLQLSGPYMIKKLIDFVKTGKAQWNFELTDLNSGTEYGILLVAALVLSQGVTYFL